MHINKMEEKAIHSILRQLKNHFAHDALDMCFVIPALKLRIKPYVYSSLFDVYERIEHSKNFKPEV